MSYASVYKIRQDGDVETYAEVRNGMAGAPVIWRKLGEKVGLGRFGDEDKLWKLFGTGRFSRQDDLCLGFTFDGTYVRREHIPELVEALEAFHLAHCEGIVPTISGMAKALRRLYDEDPGARGACFQQTSVCENPWSFYDGENDESRSFNFDRDTVNAYKAETFEVVDELDRKLGTAPTEPGGGADRG